MRLATRRPRSLSLRQLLAASLLGVAAPGIALAQDTAAPAPAPTSPAGVLNLSATASAEVTRDLLSVSFSTSREGADATTVQTQLKQALDAALAEARKAARPGQVDVQTGGFSLYPRYNAKGQSSGWSGTAELIVEGRDLPAIAQLTARIGTMTIARVGYGLSRERREQVEAELTAQAIARFRSKAEQMARQFGYGSAAVREVSVSDSEVGGMVPMAAPRMKAMAASVADESLPVEAGKGQVSVTVSGSVQMR